MFDSITGLLDKNTSQRHFGCKYSDYLDMAIVFPYIFL